MRLYKEKQENNQQLKDTYTNIRKVWCLLFILFVSFPFCAAAGVDTYSTPGTYTYTVPSYSSLTIEVWGAGGGGGGASYSGGNQSGGNGGNSSAAGLVANGGRGGQTYSVGAGGTASGGTTNLTGASGTDSGDDWVGGNGGAGANGGAGGMGYNTHTYSASTPGTAPGGGGGAQAGGNNGSHSTFDHRGNGGGGGGYSAKTFAPGELTPGSTITVVVGTGGVRAWNGGQGNGTSQVGGNGRVIINATVDTAPSIPTISGPTNGVPNIVYSYTLTATDPENNSITYEIDWDNNGTVDETSSSRASGASYTTSNSWAGIGTKTFQARAVDSYGLASGWASYSVNITNEAPTAPTLTGPTSGNPNTDYTYTFQSTDPEGNQVRYGVDWDNDGDTDQWLPSASTYVNSETQLSAVNQWAGAGVKTFGVVARDSLGALSATTTYTVTITNIPTVTLSASTVSYIPGDSPVTLSWSSTDASTCTGTNFATGNAVNGSTIVTPAETTTYSITCTGTGGTSAPSNVTVSLWLTTCQASVLLSGDFRGWFKVLSANGIQPGGWDGLISLHQTSIDAISYGISLLNGVFSGYGWGSQTVGWVDFSRARTLFRCTPTYTCVDAQTIHNSCTDTTTSCTAPAYYCAPGLGVCQFDSPDYIPSTYDGLSFSGHLQITPKLVRKGNTTRIHWQVEDVTNCTVTSSGSPQDSWSGNASPAAGYVSKDITEQTRYTLSCLDLLGIPVSETATVNITPEFRER